MKTRWFVTFTLLALLLGGCQTTCYATMAKFGHEKRDLLKQAVLAARDEQKDAAKEFKDALTRLKELYAFAGGDLEKNHTKLKSQADDCEAQAATVRKRIKDLDQVAHDLFAEWEQVLYLKHNLNAAAIGSLRGEATSIQNDIGRLLGQMNTASAPRRTGCPPSATRTACSACPTRRPGPSPPTTTTARRRPTSSPAAAATSTTSPARPSSSGNLDDLRAADLPAPAVNLA